MQQVCEEAKADVAASTQACKELATRVQDATEGAASAQAACVRVEHSLRVLGDGLRERKLAHEQVEQKIFALDQSIAPLVPRIVECQEHADAQVAALRAMIEELPPRIDQ